VFNELVWLAGLRSIKFIHNLASGPHPLLFVERNGDAIKWRILLQDD
jgi:hypothetical protein